MSRLIKNVHLVAFFFLVTACVSTPPPSPLSSESVSEAAREISGSSYRVPDTTDINDVDQRTIKVRDRLLVPIQRVCLSYGEVSERKCEKGFAFTIVEDDDFNASAHGSNSITINSGLIRRTVSEEELAFVLAHEAGHHIANHLKEDAVNSTVGGIVGGLLMGAVTVGVMSALGVECNSNYEDCSWEEDVIEAGVKDGVDMGKGYSIARYSREQEFEADRIASAILRDTRMDIAKVVPLMAYMGKQFGTERFSEFGDSHPSGTERLAAFLQDNQLVNQGYVRSNSGEKAIAEVAREGMLSNLTVSTSGFGWVDVNDENGAEILSKLSAKGFSRTVSKAPPLRITVSKVGITKLAYKGKALNAKPFADSNGLAKFVLCPEGDLVKKISRCAELRAEVEAERIKNSVASVKKHQSIGRLDHDLGSLAISTTGYGWVDVSNANGKELVSKVSVSGFERVIKASPPLRITVSKVGITKLSYKGKALNAKPFADSDGLAKFVLCADGAVFSDEKDCP